MLTSKKMFTRLIVVLFAFYGICDVVKAQCGVEGKSEINRRKPKVIHFS